MMKPLISSGNFESFINDTKHAKTADELFAIFKTSLEYQGYDRVIFTIISDKDISPEDCVHGVMYNYPEDWQKYYRESNFEKIDPVIKYIPFANEPFFWDEFIKSGKLSEAQTTLLEEAEEAGLNNGIGIAIKGSGLQMSGFGLASSQKYNTQDVNLDLVHAYCQQFFLCYKRLYQQNKSYPFISKNLLSPRQELILTWAANGKTNEEIAMILSMSKHTVDTHMRHILQKLDCTNKTHAIVKALMWGLISP